MPHKGVLTRERRSLYGPTARHLLTSTPPFERLRSRATIQQHAAVLVEQQHDLPRTRFDDNGSHAAAMPRLVSSASRSPPPRPPGPQAGRCASGELLR